MKRRTGGRKLACVCYVMMSPWARLQVESPKGARKDVRFIRVKNQTLLHIADFVKDTKEKNILFCVVSPDDMFFFFFFVSNPSQ